MNHRFLIRENSMAKEQSLLASSQLLVSFLAGVVSSSLVCWWMFGRNNESTSSSSLRRDSWLRRSLSSMEDLTSRIGELPARTKRMHWPWDKRRTSRSSKQQQQQNPSSVITEEDEIPETDEVVRPQDKTGPCIGSIFGLDVGGTLAKLVYFEQGSHEDTSMLIHRERIAYHRAASAQVVLEARKATPQQPSEDVENIRGRRRHSFDSDQDLEDLYRMRQESVPAHLAEYGSVRENPTAEIFRPTFGKLHGSDYQDDGIPKENGIKKSRSMLALSSQSKDHAEALDRFYTFARRLDTYETTVKDKHLSFYSRQLGGEFHFVRFETRQMHSAMDLIRMNNLHLNIVEMGATGGGAHKYAADWERVLGIKMVKQGEMDSLVAGIQFVLSTVIGECYTYRPKFIGGMENRSSSDTSLMGMPLEGSDGTESDEPIQDETREHDKIDTWWWSRKVQRDVVSATYPYLLVTIGTGVSIIRVDGPRKHTRVSGSTIGGGTYWGLIRLLTDVEIFEDAMSLAKRGDPSKVDMMVGDIYGKNVDALEKLGLPSNLVASSFGKLVAKQDPAAGLKQEDLARALLLMVTINIGQVAYLNAQLHKTSRIYFVGNFLRHNTLSQRRLSYAIDYWSGGKMEALFLEHEGYFAALGAFLLSQEIGHMNGEGSDDGVPERNTDSDEDSVEGYFGALGSFFQSPGRPKSHRRSKTMG